MLCHSICGHNNWWGVIGPEAGSEKYLRAFRVDRLL